MRGKTMFLRLFLTLLLMAGLTVDFHTMSLGFGTAAYACSDDDDWGDDDGWDECVYDSHDFAADYYTDIDGDYNPWDGDNPFTPEIEEGRDYNDDDDDCTFCDMHTVDDFIYYIESGEAGRDGIDGHVWNDPDEFSGYASENEDIWNAVEFSGGSFEYDDDSGSGDSGSDSSGIEYNGFSDQSESNADPENSNEMPVQSSQDTSGEGEGAEGAKSESTDLINTDVNDGEEKSIDGVKATLEENGAIIVNEYDDDKRNVHVIEYFYPKESKGTRVGTDGYGYVFEHNYHTLDIPISSNESNDGGDNSSNSENNSNTSQADNTENSNIGDTGSSSSNSTSSGNSSSGNSGNNHSGNSNSWNYGNSGNSGNSGNNHSGNSGDSGSIETISADDEGEYEPTDNTPSTTEPEPTPQEQPEYKEPEKDSDCSEESIQMSQQVSDLYNQELFADSFNELKEATKTDTEKIFSIGRDYAGNLSVGGMHSGDGRTSYSSDIPNMVATAHSHPQGDFSCFSVSDFYSLASENMADSRFSTIFVVGERATYAMQVTDATKLREFIDEHPRSEFVDPDTGGFVEGSALNFDLSRYIRNLSNDNFSYEDSFAHAMSMFMFSHDIGVSVMKAEFGENGDVEFKEVKTKGVLDPETNEIRLKATECQ